MTHKSQLFTFIITAIFVGLLANCGPSNPDNTVEPSSSQTDTPQSTTSQTGQKAESSNETKATSNKPTLVYYQMPG